jgi:DNA-binding transcriptional MerR regulator
MAMNFEALKVGELARRTGLTVRTLHHYDEMGLLKPSLHSEAGYRLYTRDDVARLQQVLSLRQLGFALEEIRDCFDRPGFAPLEVIRLHLTRLREQIELQRKLCERLEALAEHFRAAEEVSADEFLQTIEGINMIEQCYTPEQLEHFRKCWEANPEQAAERARQGTAAWEELWSQLGALMEQGTDPADPKVQALIKRRQELVDQFTGGDKAIEESLKRMWTEEGDKLCAQFGMDPKVLQYLVNAEAVVRGSD